jgi:hypothetical protein
VIDINRQPWSATVLVRAKATHLVLLAICALVLPHVADAQSASDSAAVRRASLDYLEGFYEGDTAKLTRAVRPDVFKYGYYRNSKDSSITGEQMSWAGFISYALKVKASSRPTPATAPKEVVILDMLDQTASVRVRAWWGYDYLLVGRHQGRWLISHVLWQSPPVPPKGGAR